ncbi:hypothetical protein CRYUN_Cryun09bG0180200 [Craigia yunnanensis]
MVFCFPSTPKKLAMTVGCFLAGADLYTIGTYLSYVYIALQQARTKARDDFVKERKKSQSITITNDKGRLSQEEIERMVKEAEEFAEEDKKLRENIDSRNKLETYTYNMRSSIEDKDKLEDKIDSDDKEKIERTLKEALEWLDDNQMERRKILMISLRRWKQCAIQS